VKGVRVQCQGGTWEAREKTEKSWDAMGKGKVLLGGGKGEKFSLVETEKSWDAMGKGKVLLGGGKGKDREKLGRNGKGKSPPCWRQGKSSPENVRPGGLSFPGGIMEVLLDGGKGKVLQKISDRVV
jgi:hypothetical protein